MPIIIGKVIRSGGGGYCFVRLLDGRTAFLHLNSYEEVFSGVDGPALVGTGKHFHDRLNEGDKIYCEVTSTPEQKVPWTVSAWTTYQEYQKAEAASTKLKEREKK